ncbi:MAG: hypothetical protein WCR76_10625 [Sphaerochaetaceae bacterium]
MVYYLCDLTAERLRPGLNTATDHCPPDQYISDQKRTAPDMQLFNLPCRFFGREQKARHLCVAITLGAVFTAAAAVGAFPIIHNSTEDEQADQSAGACCLYEVFYTGYTDDDGSLTCHANRGANNPISRMVICNQKNRILTGVLTATQLSA